MADELTDATLKDTITGVTSAHLEGHPVNVIVLNTRPTMVDGIFWIVAERPDGISHICDVMVDLQRIPREYQLDYVHCQAHALCGAVIRSLYSTP